MKAILKSLRTMLLLVFLLCLIFTALPLILTLIMDKSSPGLALFSIWYPFFPPAVLFLLSLWIYRKESSNAMILGRIWMSVGLWFALQAVLSALSEFSIIFRLLSLPAVYAGGKGFLPGMLLFLLGGFAIYYHASLRQDKRESAPSRRFFPFSFAAMIILTFVALPLWVSRYASLGGRALLEEAKVPAQSEIFSWITDVYNFGERRTGSEASQKTIAYLQKKLHAVGISDVRVEPYSFDYWEAVAWGLSVNEERGKTTPVPSFYVPYSGPTDKNGITSEMVYVGQGRSDDFKGVQVKGRIILVDLPAVNINWDRMKIFSYLAYDPSGTTKGWEHPYPIGWIFKYEAVYHLALKHGAAGIVGILQDYPDMGKFTYYAPYDGIFRKIPSLYVMQKDGKKLKASLAKGKLTARVILAAKTAKQGGKTATVYGILPGRSSSSLLIHSHHDAPWRSGIEDSSGVGMVLSLAKYFAQIPPEKRDRTLIFMFTGSHMVGARGNDDFIRKHRGDIMKNVLYDICLEHIADDYTTQKGSSGNPEPRGLFITENPVLASLYTLLVVRHDIKRLLLFPTKTPLGVPTDAQPFFNAGYNIASMISGPSWLFDDDDTLERVAKKELVPLTRFNADLVANMGLHRDCALAFNLNIAVIFLLALVLSPMALAALIRRR